MKASFGQSWTVKKRTVRRAAPRLFATPASGSDSDDDAPERANERTNEQQGAFNLGHVKVGEAVKDGSKRSAWGAALKLVLVVFALARAKTSNPLLPYTRGRPGKYYHKSHRKELSAGVSRFLADTLFAACSGAAMPPPRQYASKLDNDSPEQAERARLDRELAHDAARGGTCYFTAVKRAFPCARAWAFGSARAVGPLAPARSGLAAGPARRALSAATHTAATRRTCLR